MSTSDRVQTVRNAWINAIRAEVLRVDIPELPRIANVGTWIATYADADGGGAFPSRETLARLAGASKESVTRAIKVLMAVGMLQRKRRPNQSSVYQLVIPMERPDWDAHIHLYTDTRQRRARAAKKEREAAELETRTSATPARAATSDAFRTANSDALQDARTATPVSHPDGDPGRLPEGADSVPGRPRKASPDAFRTATPAGAYQYIPTSGRDPQRDQEMAEHSPQPQKRAGAGSENDQDPPPTADFTRCARCHGPMVPRPGRTTHAHCTPTAAPGTERNAS